MCRLFLDERHLGRATHSAQPPYPFPPPESTSKGEKLSKNRAKLRYTTSGAAAHGSAKSSSNHRDCHTLTTSSFAQLARHPDTRVALTASITELTMRNPAESLNCEKLLAVARRVHYSEA